MRGNRNLLKRIIAVGMVVSMMMSTSAVAFADETEDVDDSTEISMDIDSEGVSEEDTDSDSNDSEVTGPYRAPRFTTVKEYKKTLSGWSYVTSKSGVTKTNKGPDNASDWYAFLATLGEF